LPPAYIQKLLEQYIYQFYSDNEKTLSIFKLIIEADRLFGISSDEINMQLAKGTVEKWESVLHTSVLNFITKSIQDDPKFLEQDIKTQIEKLEAMAKEKLPEQPEVQQPDIYQQPNAA
jgi:hypothetical protein